MVFVTYDCEETHIPWCGNGVYGFMCMATTERRPSVGALLHGFNFIFSKPLHRTKKRYITHAVAQGKKPCRLH